MDCNKAGLLMMKYMDKNITPEEQLSLEKHVDKCEYCKEEFEIYKNMTFCFEPIQDDTPKDVILTSHFEKCVMTKITLMDQQIENRYKLLLGTYSVSFGFFVAALLLTIDVDYSQLATGIIANLSFVFSNIGESVYYTTQQFNIYLSAIQYYTMAVLVILVPIYFFMHVKNNARAAR